MKRVELKRNQEKGGVVAYIGPSFYGVVERGTVFEDGLPPKLRALIETHPFMSGLLVPVMDLSKARKELKTPGSEKYLLYRRAMDGEMEEKHV